MPVTPPGRPRYESLDVWRGAACLLVVLFHSVVYLASAEFDARVRAAGGSPFDWFIVAAGRFWIGVPLFFVVSGYCIAASADAVRGGSGGAGRYFARRAWRIYPPLWVAIGLAVAAPFAQPHWARPGPTSEGMAVLPAPDRLSPEQWVGNLTLTESWRPALGGPGSDFVLGQLWTLCYEEQFYLVVGVLLLVARRWFFPGVWLVTGLVLFNLSALNPYPLRVAGAFTDGLWVAFAAGVAAYYRLRHAPPALGPAIEGAVLVLGAAAVAGEADPFDTRQTLAKYIACACACAVLLCRLHRFDATLATARATAPLRFCGRMCYSLYLTHPLVTAPLAWVCYRAGLTSPAATVLVTLPLCTLLAVGAGGAFYWAVERRFLNGPRPGSRKTSSRLPSRCRPEYTSPVPSRPSSSRTPPCPAARFR